MRYSSLAAICLLVALLFTLPGYAQNTANPPFTPPPGCGGIAIANTENPIEILSGYWAFRLHGFGVENPGAFGVEGAVGVFQATIGAARSTSGTQAPKVGVITANVTVNTNGTLLPNYGPFTGKYQVDPDCSGGTLMLGTGANPTAFRQLQFVFFDGQTAMYLVTDDNNGGVVVGEARKIAAPMACPAIPLAGYWAFRLEGFGTAPFGVNRFHGGVGVFNASAITPMNGGITARVTVNTNGTVLPNYGPFGGLYQLDWLTNNVLDANNRIICPGGNVMLGDGAVPTDFRNFHFVYFNDGNSMFLVNADNNGGVLVGEAHKLAALPPR